MAYEDVISALADKTRRDIFETLVQGSKTVGELAADQPVSRPAVSQHLRVLELAGLVGVVPMGNRRIYSARRAGLEELRKYVDQFWSDTLSAYGDEVSRQIQSKKGGENA